MNIHPIFVHFPIAFLTIYAIAECIRAGAFFQSDAWRRTKEVLLLVGTAGAFLALGTGDFGIRDFLSARAIIGLHETFAQATTTVFCVLLAYYLIDEVWRKWGAVVSAKPNGALISKTVAIIRSVFSAPVIVLLAVIGLVGITITGALGGAIVYGPNADPAVHFIYSIFF